MYKFLKQLFSRSSTNKADNHSFICSLNLELTIEDSINILCYWPDLDKLSHESIKALASKYATLIYLIDSGQMKREIIETLLSVNKKNNIEDAMFIECLLKNWSGLVDKNENAVIKPSNVFKNYK